ncbi:MAG: DUF4446 family protein [Lachnospiraceae bacterium]|nr:DUF4446 family protein [Lachnospiraceae bacterium]
MSPAFEAIGIKLDIGILFVIMLVLVIGMGVLCFLTINKYKKLERKYNKFMQGSRAKSLETQIMDLVEKVEELTIASDQHENNITNLYRKHEFAFQKMGLVKYDAFKEMGGKLSYCISLLDENDNGYVLSSVHSSSGCFSYMKRIKGGECEINLSPEEKLAVDRAMKRSKETEK